LKNLEETTELNRYHIVRKSSFVYTGGTPFRNTPFSQHCTLFATLFRRMKILPRDPFSQHFRKNYTGCTQCATPKFQKSVTHWGHRHGKMRFFEKFVPGKRMAKKRMTIFYTLAFETLNGSWNFDVFYVFPRQANLLEFIRPSRR